MPPSAPMARYVDWRAAAVVDTECSALRANLDANIEATRGASV